MEDEVRLAAEAKEMFSGGAQVVPPGDAPDFIGTYEWVRRDEDGRIYLSIAMNEYKDIMIDVTEVERANGGWYGTTGFGRTFVRPAKKEK